MPGRHGGERACERLLDPSEQQPFLDPGGIGTDASEFLREPGARLAPQFAQRDSTVAKASHGAAAWPGRILALTQNGPGSPTW